MIRINNIKTSIKNSDAQIKNKINKILHTNKYEIIKIVRKSIDARDKSDIKYVFTIDVQCKNEEQIASMVHSKNVMLTNDNEYFFPYIKTPTINASLRPVIIGAGPAGYFAALWLSRAGYNPIVIERGKCVEKRTKDVEDFWNGQSINPNSNVSFGEGGAGTFSDGKLNTGINDKSGRIISVLNDFVRFGADEDITYNSKPHIGTDVLKKIMKNMRTEIIKLGGEIHFETMLSDIKTNGSIISITTEGEFTQKIDTHSLILAIGHSARDTFSMLHKNNIPMEAKAFAIGLRIEHPADLINVSQYGESDDAKLLPAADYKMTFKSSEDRSVYSFCMCPGGKVVNASSDVYQSVVNGMSYHDRDGRNSNSAIVVNVTPSDYIQEGFEAYGVLAGVEFQKKIEKLAYEEGKGCIPVQKFIDYVSNCKSTELGKIKPDICGKYTLGNLNNCLPTYVNNAIIESIVHYGKKLKGFDREDAVLSGVESRTSSPVRIVRDNNYMSHIKGVFPCGEGAGYAGGITSAAVDGIKIAEAVASYENDLI